MNPPGEKPTEPDKASDPQQPTARMLLWAYTHGVFPMHDPHSDLIEWFSPDPRGMIPLESFRMPRNLARAVRQGRFRISSDSAFEAVMRACAAPRAEENPSWINDRLIAAYTELYEQGHAHSVEAWRAGELVGGLYGVHIGAAFFGESMFVRPGRGGTNASKICLVHLVNHLRRRNFRLLDTQFWNPHLGQFGCIEIPRDEYLRRLREAIMKPVPWRPFSESGPADERA